MTIRETVRNEKGMYGWNTTYYVREFHSAHMDDYEVVGRTECLSWLPSEVLDKEYKTIRKHTEMFASSLGNQMRVYIECH